MNQKLTKERHVWDTLNFGKRLLVWDAYKCHLMESVKANVKNHTKSKLSIIPGDLTKHLQPA